MKCFATVHLALWTVILLNNTQTIATNWCCFIAIMAGQLNRMIYTSYAIHLSTAPAIALLNEAKKSI